MTEFANAKNVQCEKCGLYYCPEEGDCPGCADRAETCLKKISEIVGSVERPSIENSEAETILAAWRLDEVLTEIKGVCDKYGYMTGAW